MSEQAKLPKGVQRFLWEADQLTYEPPESAPTEHGAHLLAPLGEYFSVDDLPAILAQRDSEWRSGLLGEEARQAAGRAAFEDFDPDGAWEALDEPLRLTWEGNTAAGIEAAIDKGAPDGGGGE